MHQAGISKISKAFQTYKFVCTVPQTFINTHLWWQILEQQGQNIYIEAKTNFRRVAKLETDKYGDGERIMCHFANVSNKSD